MKEYYPTIGIECHVQLKTKTKLFSGVGNDARGAKPNSLISHIDVGMPGSLPVLNEQAVYLAARAAFALGTKPQKHFKFDRKHYFYPDLPKGYQITQYDEPIISGGHVNIRVGGKTKRVGITRAHMEEDAGKNTHPKGADYSLVDLNRAGTPLLEIVSEPDINSAEEAKAYAKELYLLMRYADVSDCDLYHGNMRFDVNVSLSGDPKKLGTRCEVKNLNSFKSVHNAVEYEIKRQSELLRAGKPVVQETRGWDEAKQKTISQRGKEEAHDYRYFPEPDIPPVELDDKFIAEVQKSIRFLPDELRLKLEALNIDAAVAEVLVDEIRVGEFMFSELEEVGQKHARRIALWLAVEGQALVSSGKLDWEKAKLDVKAYERLSQMVDDSEISVTAAKKIFAHLLQKSGEPMNVAKELKLLQMSDSNEIEKIVQGVMKDNPKVVTQIKAGEDKAIGFLIGQVMQKSGGRANPTLARELIIKNLKK